MHPVLASPRRLALYLVAWAPFLVLVDGILRGAGMHGWQRLALSTAMTVVYAFFALSAWFACWSAPLATSSPLQIFKVQAGWAIGERRPRVSRTSPSTARLPREAIRNVKP